MAYTLALSEAEIARYRMMAEGAKASESELWTSAGIVTGARVADVGCGPGAVLALVSERVGPTGRVVGVDADDEALGHARALLDASGASNATLQLGQADDTGLEPASVDVVMMRHVLAHNGGAEQRIVDHLASLVRPGGCVYLVDVDLTLMRVHPAPDGVLDMLSAYVEFHRSLGNDPEVGLSLRRFAVAAGLEPVEYRGSITILAEVPRGMRPPIWAARDAMVAQGAATAEDVARWAAAFERLDTVSDRPSMFAPLFILVARRPPAG